MYDYAYNGFPEFKVRNTPMKCYTFVKEVWGLQTNKILSR